MVVNSEVTGDAFTVSRPRVWSEYQLRNSGNQNFDLALDGARFAVQEPASGPSSLESRTFMLQPNFFDEIRRKVGAGL